MCLPIYRKRQPCAKSYFRNCPENRGLRRCPKANCKRFRWRSKQPMQAGIPRGRLDLRNRLLSPVLVVVGRAEEKSFL